MVPHRSTNQARTCLTSLSRREAVLSSWYGRSRNYIQTRRLYQSINVWFILPRQSDYDRSHAWITARSRGIPVTVKGHDVNSTSIKNISYRSRPPSTKQLYHTVQCQLDQESLTILARSTVRTVVTSVSQLFTARFNWILDFARSLWYNLSSYYLYRINIPYLAMYIPSSLDRIKRGQARLQLSWDTWNGYLSQNLGLDAAHAILYGKN